MVSSGIPVPLCNGIEFRKGDDSESLRVALGEENAVAAARNLQAHCVIAVEMQAQ
jgi:hypothetical protein